MKDICKIERRKEKTQHPNRNQELIMAMSFLRSKKQLSNDSKCRKKSSFPLERRLYPNNVNHPTVLLLAVLLLTALKLLSESCVQKIPKKKSHKIVTEL